MAQLTTYFTPSPWCSNRFAVFIDDEVPGTSTLPPTSGWVDPSFSKCIPTQYTTPYPVFSPGVCPAHMGIVGYTYGTHHGKTIWTGACCQSGFSPMSINPNFICTSTITSPMAFLLVPNISTTDIHTTLPAGLVVEHDQVTVKWEASDLDCLPVGVAYYYALMMGITALSPMYAATGTAGVLSPSTTELAWPTQAPSNRSTITTSTPQSSASETQPRDTATSDGNLPPIIASAFLLLAIGVFLNLM